MLFTDNSDSDAKNDCIKDLYKHLNIAFDKDNLTDENFDLAIEGENDLLKGIEISKIKSFVERWKTNNEVHTEVVAYTYWDGSNHKSLALTTDFGEPDVNELDEEKRSKAILKNLQERFM